MIQSKLALQAKGSTTDEINDVRTCYEAADAAIADGEEATLRAHEVEEAKDIKFERQIAPADAIVEPYYEVEDVAENVLIDLSIKDRTLQQAGIPTSSILHFNALVFIMSDQL